MTREQTKELMPIIQAFAEGKTIQIRDAGGTWWDVMDSGASFSQPVDAYRVKPEPREWIIFTDGETIYHKGQFDCDDPKVMYGANTALKAIRVREILD